LTDRVPDVRGVVPIPGRLHMSTGGGPLLGGGGFYGTGGGGFMGPRGPYGPYGGCGCSSLFFILAIILLAFGGCFRMIGF
jgi:hypothetical protein